MEEHLIFNEGGISWNWFTKLTLHRDGTVTIHLHDRLHKGDGWPEEFRTAPVHPNYYHEKQWKEDKERKALEYYVPEVGWCKIRNQQNIFSYKEVLNGLVKL